MKKAIKLIADLELQGIHCEGHRFLTSTKSTIFPVFSQGPIFYFLVLPVVSLFPVLITTKLVVTASTKSNHLTPWNSVFGVKVKREVMETTTKLATASPGKSKTYVTQKRFRHLQGRPLLGGSAHLVVVWKTPTKIGFSGVKTRVYKWSFNPRNCWRGPPCTMVNHH